MFKKDDYFGLTPAKIIYNGVATVVFWCDGTKTVVKRSCGAKDDKYNAFCAALAKKVYGSNSKLKKSIENAENAKSVKKNMPIKVGDRVRILDGSNIPDYAGNWVSDMKKYVGKITEVTRKTISYETGVKLEGNSWTWDIRGLEKV